MARKMLLIAAAIENSMIARGSVVCNLAPIRLKKEFGISCSNYAANKRAACEYVEKILSTTDRQRMEKACIGGKKDDVADGLLFGKYGCMFYDDLVQNARIKSLQEQAADKKAKKLAKAAAKAAAANSSAANSATQSAPARKRKLDGASPPKARKRPKKAAKQGTEKTASTASKAKKKAPAKKPTKKKPTKKKPPKKPPKPAPHGLGGRGRPVRRGGGGGGSDFV